MQSSAIGYGLPIAGVYGLRLKTEVETNLFKIAHVPPITALNLQRLVVGLIAGWLAGQIVQP
jgi:hypothetical protein